MRQRDPRRLLAARRYARAHVNIVEVPQSGHEADGSVTTRQAAEVILPRRVLEQLWTPEYLERLARTYWRFLTRVSLGILRVRYTETSREIVVLTRPIVLMRFKAPEYEIEGDGGTVTWRIDRGLLVAPAGRGKGYLRLSVWRAPERPIGSDEATVYVSSEVASFFPTIVGRGWFGRIGRFLYKFTQLRIHLLVTNAFLRSLARLDLAESVVGALKSPQPPVPSPQRESSPQTEG
jgi:hypothetical protein